MPVGYSMCPPSRLQCFLTLSTQGLPSHTGSRETLVAQPCSEEGLSVLNSSASVRSAWLSQARICSLSWPSAGGGSLWRGGVREIEDLAELAELPVVPGSDNQVQIRRRQRFVGEQAGMGIAHAGRNNAASYIGRGLVDHP